MRTHGLIWLLITLLIFLVAPILRPAEAFLSVVEAETSESIRWYAPSEVRRITANADGIYKAAMVDSGLDSAIRDNLVPSEAPSPSLTPDVRLPDSVVRWADQFVGYWVALLCNVYLFCFRLAHSWVWMGYLLPFCVAIVVDGYLARKAKLVSFAYTSPTAYNVSWHVMIFIVCFSIVYFALPVQISVFYYPTVIVLFGAMARILIGNIQHSA